MDPSMGRLNAEESKLMKDSSVASGATKQWIEGWMRGWQEGFNFKKSGADRALKMMTSSSNDNIPLFLPTSQDFHNFGNHETGRNKKPRQFQSQASQQYKSYNQKMPEQSFKFDRGFGNFQNNRWNNQKGVFETFIPLTSSSSNKKDYFGSYTIKGQYKPPLQGDYSHTVYLYKE